MLLDVIDCSKSASTTRPPRPQNRKNVFNILNQKLSIENLAKNGFQTNWGLLLDHTMEFFSLLALFSSSQLFGTGGWLGECIRCLFPE